MFDPDRQLRHINRGLIVLLGIIICYLVTVPLIPLVILFGNNYSGKPEHLHRLVSDSSVSKDSINSLYIPTIGLDEPIIEGSDAGSVGQGVWRWPASSTPDRGGNTVLLGERFAYSKPASVFFALGSVTIKDQIGVIWQHKMYRYTVIGTSTADAADTSVTAPTTVPTLTLYTSNPAWWPSNRLVITAQLEDTP
jgi:LPXTG-site transpeptidase (sortase) family protein